MVLINGIFLLVIMMLCPAWLVLIVIMSVINGLLGGIKRR